MGKVYWRSQEGAMQEQGETPAILALGDSWFWYPANNLLNPVNRFGGQPTILCYGDNGAEAVELLHPSHFEPFRKALAGYPSIEIVMLSAGGNDFAGLQDFDALLNDDCSKFTTPEACFKGDEPAKLLKTVMNAYREIVDKSLSIRKRATILVHNYDYAIPTGIGFLGLSQWLKAPMDACKVPAKGALKPGSLRRRVVSLLIDALGAELATLEADYAGKVIYVRTPGTLADDEWVNELHPTPGGFSRLGKQRFAPVVKGILES